jgi:hypothetical protein
MKKFVVLSLIGLIILVFGTAYAQEEKAPVFEFKASGIVDTLGVLKRNLDAAAMPFGVYGPVSSTYQPGGGAYNKTASYMATRMNLKFDAMMGKDITGTVYFEMDSSRWGELTPAADQRNAMGVTTQSGDRGAVEIKNCYLTFGVPVVPIPITMSLGLQGLVIRPDWILANDGVGIVMAAKPIDPMQIKFLWGKLYEGNDAAADDGDEYAVELSYNISTFTVGAYGLFQNINTYPIPAAVPAYGPPATNNSADVWWFGGYLDGKLGPVNAKLDFAIDTGKIKNRDDVAARPCDVKLTGWAARAWLDFPWEKFNFGVNFTYASGADQKKTAANGLPGTANTPWATDASKNSSYMTPLSSEEFGAFTGNGSLVFYGSWVIRGNEFFNTPAAAATGYLGRGAIGGTWYIKGIAGFKVIPEWKTSIEALYIGDTTKNGNTVGNARTDAGNPRDDKGIGFEVDFINSISIYKNLTLDIGLGYLFAGKALDYWDKVSANDSPKDPWILCSRLCYSF